MLKRWDERIVILDYYLFIITTLSDLIRVSIKRGNTHIQRSILIVGVIQDINLLQFPGSDRSVLNKLVYIIIQNCRMDNTV